MHVSQQWCTSPVKMISFVMFVSQQWYTCKSQLKRYLLWCTCPSNDTQVPIKTISFVMQHVPAMIHKSQLIETISFVIHVSQQLLCRANASLSGSCNYACRANASLSGSCNYTYTGPMQACRPSEDMYLHEGTIPYTFGQTFDAKPSFINCGHIKSKPFLHWGLNCQKLALCMRVSFLPPSANHIKLYSRKWPHA